MALKSFTLVKVGPVTRASPIAAKNPCPGISYFFGRFHDLPLGFDRTGSRHHNEFIASDFKTVDPHLRALLLELFADKLVRRGDAHGLFHLRHGLHRLQAGGHVAYANHADHDALFSLDGVDFISKVFNARAHLVDLLFGRVQFH